MVILCTLSSDGGTIFNIFKTQKELNMSHIIYFFTKNYKD